MDRVTLGQRLAQAREDAGITQESLAQAVGIDRTAITRLEKGERKLSVPELVTIAEKLHRPLTYFTEEPVAAAISRRQDAGRAHETTRALDAELELFAADVRSLLDLKLLKAAERSTSARIPKSHAAAESMAKSVRKRLGLENGPIVDLGRICEELGLVTYSARLGASGPDGGCVEVPARQGTLGAAVINGEQPSGRRRMTLAHELGHWLCGDAYDQSASADSERLINSFAIHFLAPRAGIRSEWNHRSDWSQRDRAIGVGTLYGLSWSATIGQLKNLDLISAEQRDYLASHEPLRGDHTRLGLPWINELEANYLSPAFAASCVRGYVGRQLTVARTIELLRGTLTDQDLPEQDQPEMSELRRHFIGHGS